MSGTLPTFLYAFVSCMWISFPLPLSTLVSRRLHKFSDCRFMSPFTSFSRFLPRRNCQPIVNIDKFGDIISSSFLALLVLVMECACYAFRPQFVHIRIHADVLVHLMI